MKGFLSLSLVVCCAFTSILGVPQSIDTAKSDSAHRWKATIEGLVRDIACPIQNLEATATHLSMKCVLACARNGSPLVILSKDGDLYLPISDKMPDQDQRPTLMPFLGKYVRASVTVCERKGTHAIVIHKVQELKDIHLTIDNQ